MGEGGTIACSGLRRATGAEEPAIQLPIDGPRHGEGAGAGDAVAVHVEGDEGAHAGLRSQVHPGAVLGGHHARRNNADAGICAPRPVDLPVGQARTDPLRAHAYERRPRGIHAPDDRDACANSQEDQGVVHDPVLVSIIRGRRNPSRG